MSRPALLILLVAALGAAAMTAAFAAAGRARSQRTTQRAPAPPARAGALAQPPPLTRVRSAPAPAASYETAAVERGRSIALRAKPNGRVVTHVSASTEFGSPTVLSVAAHRGGWLGVTSTSLSNDKLSGAQYGPYYGCCILALSGHQPHTPAGWQGGDRLAIHGTDAPAAIGTPASAGCLRASDRDLRVLMRRVPLGAPVFIRA